MHPVQTVRRLDNGSYLSQSARKNTQDHLAFSPGRLICNQQLNLTQYIKDGYETCITGAAYFDVTASYNMSNLRIFLIKLAKMTKTSLLSSDLSSETYVIFRDIWAEEHMAYFKDQCWL